MRRTVLAAIALAACASAGPVRITGAAPLLPSGYPDSTYGFSQDNPIKVGGIEKGFGVGPQREHDYLGRLRGPNGERVTFARLGSCCPFKSPRAPIENTGLLDSYEVSYPGLSAPVTLYLNFYDQDTLKAPVGFVLR